MPGVRHPREHRARAEGPGGNRCDREFGKPCAAPGSRDPAVLPSATVALRTWDCRSVHISNIGNEACSFPDRRRGCCARAFIDNLEHLRREHSPPHQIEAAERRPSRPRELVWGDGCPAAVAGISDPMRDVTPLPDLLSHGHAYAGTGPRAPTCVCRSLAAVQCRLPGGSHPHPRCGFPAKRSARALTQASRARAETRGMGSRQDVEREEVDSCPTA